MLGEESIVPRISDSYGRDSTRSSQQGGSRLRLKFIMNCKKKDDELFAWCKERKETMFVEIDDDTQAAVARIMRDHPKLVDTTKGRSGADPFVIALAATGNPTMTVVTEEFLGKSRIPDVCNAQKILWCGVADLIEKEDWRSGN
jgi:hypothetical protein